MVGNISQSGSEAGIQASERASAQAHCGAVEATGPRDRGAARAVCMLLHSSAVLP